MQSFDELLKIGIARYAGSATSRFPRRTQNALLIKSSARRTSRFFCVMARWTLPMPFPAPGASV